MAYTRKNWKAFPDTTTPITAENLNHMDKGIADNDVAITNLTDKVDAENIPSTLGDTVGGAINSLNESLQNKIKTTTTAVTKTIGANEKASVSIPAPTDTNYNWFLIGATTNSQALAITGIYLNGTARYICFNSASNNYNITGNWLGILK